MHIEVSLTEASIIFQLLIVFIVWFFFLTGWIITRRNILKNWTIGWLSDLLALFSVLMVVGNSELSYHARFFYLFYSVFKFAFIYFIWLGFLQFTKIFEIRKIKRYSLVLLLTAFAGTIFLFFTATSAHMQAMVFFAVGSLAFFTGIFGVKESLKRKMNASLFLSAAMTLYGLGFLHHAFMLFPLFFGGKIAGFMSRISFYDAGLELFLGITIFTVTFLRTLNQLKKTVMELEESRAKLRHLVDIDPLTGLYNRRKLRAFINAMKEKRGVIIFMDINNFKKINDLWGHTAGDWCLRRVSELLRILFREEDGLFRYGGDEFLVVVPGSIEAVKPRVERLKSELSKASALHIPISLSVGFSEFGGEISFHDALKRADRMMYEEKFKGS